MVWSKDNLSAYKPRIITAVVLPLALMGVLAAGACWWIDRLLTMARLEDSAQGVIGSGNNVLIQIVTILGVSTLMAVIFSLLTVWKLLNLSGGYRQALQAAQGPNAEVAEGQARLSLALDAAQMGTWKRDLISEKVVWSARQEALFGLPTGTFGGTHEAFLRMVHPDDRAALQEAERLVLAGKAAYTTEYRVVWPDGGTHWLVGRGDVIRDNAGRATHLAGVTMDMTAQRSGEKERVDLLAREQKARAEAEAANRRKDQFLAVLSHELRTPLTPVTARLALLLRDPALPVTMRTALQMIRRNVELETRLIEDLLDITRIARGKLHLNLETVDAHDKIRDALEIYQAEIVAKKLQVTLDLHADQHHVRADPARLQQVFWNLISNAVKYTPAGGSIALTSNNGSPLEPQTSSHAGERTKPGLLDPPVELPIRPSLVVEVVDTGIGIEPEVMSRLFDPFEQGEQTLTRSYGGLGLGLSISRTLVDMLGGQLQATSRGRGQGANLRVELATVAADSVQPALPVVPKVAARRPLRILLVEDNQDTLRVMARLLKTQGYQVKMATTIKCALETAADRKFDLLISDIGLPDGSGWELMTALRAHSPMPGIALSGFTMDEDVRKSRSVGFAAHLAKPVNLDELEEAIQRTAYAGITS